MPLTAKLSPIVRESTQSDILETMPTALSTTPQLDLHAADEQPTGPAPFESWGRYPAYGAKVIPLHWQSDFPSITDGLHSGALPVGMGRSYGDVCLLKDGNLLLTTGMNRLIDFDPETGLLTAEAGITLAQILDFCRPPRVFSPCLAGNKICNAWRSNCQRYPRQEPPRRRHLRPPRHAVRARPFRWLT